MRRGGRELWPPTLHVLTLAAEHVALKLVKRLAGLDERLSSLAVTSTETRGDKVGDTGRLLEEGGLLDVVEELEAEVLGLEKTNAHDGR